MKPPLLACVLLMTLSSAVPSRAWDTNGVIVSGATGDQRAPLTVSDGAGGVILIWVDQRGADSDVYAQRLAPNGSRLWGADGVPVCSAAGEQITPALVADGAGGAFVVWEDQRPGTTVGDVYAQRLDRNGIALWAENGVVVSAEADHQTTPQLVSDGTGGVIVTWSDRRAGNYDVYAQRLNGSGTVQWLGGDRALTSAAGDQTGPMPVLDDLGGAIVVWADTRVHAQSVDGLGFIGWGASGIEVGVGSFGDQSQPSVVTDGFTGAIVFWTDGRLVSDQDIYAQRLSHIGVRLWADSGNVVCATTGFQFLPVAISDDDGGAIVTWRDYRGTSDVDLYAQRMNALGARQWPVDGVELCTTSGDQHHPAMTPASSGIWIAAWHDFRGSSGDIYAQAVSGTGTLLWAADGVPVADPAGDQLSPSIVPDGQGGAIVAWDDARGTDADIYAARVAGDGVIVPVLLALIDAEATAGAVTLRWHTPSGTGFAATVERRTETHGWESLAQVAADASGLVTYRDLDVAPGIRYAYRLRVQEGSEPDFTDEVWIEVPLRPRLALEGARPNPAGMHALVALVLGTDEPARLKLYDLGGRLAHSRNLGATPGRHLVRIGETAGLPDGLYLMRLVQGGQAATGKLVIRK